MGQGGCVPSALLLVCRAPLLPASRTRRSEGPHGTQLPDCTPGLGFPQPAAPLDLAIARPLTSSCAPPDSPRQPGTPRYDNAHRRNGTSVTSRTATDGGPATAHRSAQVSATAAFMPLGSVGGDDGADAAARRQRDTMVTAHLPAAITVLTWDGRVIHQNPASTAYMGAMPQSPAAVVAGPGDAVGAATSPSVTAQHPPQHMPAVLRVGALQWTAAAAQQALASAGLGAPGGSVVNDAADGRGGSAGAAGAGGAVGADARVGCDGSWLLGFGVLGCIFTYEPAKLRQMLDALLSGRAPVWQGIVRVPTDVELRQLLGVPDSVLSSAQQLSSPPSHAKPAQQPATAGHATASMLHVSERPPSLPDPSLIRPPPQQQQESWSAELEAAVGAGPTRAVPPPDRCEAPSDEDAAAGAPRTGQAGTAQPGGSGRRGSGDDQPGPLIPLHASRRALSTTQLQYALPPAHSQPRCASAVRAPSVQGAASAHSALSLASGGASQWGSSRPGQHAEERPGSGATAREGREGGGRLLRAEGLTERLAAEGLSGGGSPFPTAAALAAAGASAAGAAPCGFRGGLAEAEADPFATSTWAVIADHSARRPLSSCRAASAAAGVGRGGASTCDSRNSSLAPRLQSSVVRHGGLERGNSEADAGGCHGGGARSSRTELGLARRCDSLSAATWRARSALRPTKSHANFGSLVRSAAAGGAADGGSSMPPVAAHGAGPRGALSLAAARCRAASSGDFGGGGATGDSGESSPLPSMEFGGSSSRGGIRRNDASSGAASGLTGTSRVLLFASSLRSAPFPRPPSQACMHVGSFPAALSSRPFHDPHPCEPASAQAQPAAATYHQPAAAQLKVAAPGVTTEPPAAVTALAPTGTVPLQASAGTRGLAAAMVPTDAASNAGAGNEGPVGVVAEGPSGLRSSCASMAAKHSAASQLRPASTSAVELAMEAGPEPRGASPPAEPDAMHLGGLVAQAQGPPLHGEERHPQPPPQPAAESPQPREPPASAARTEAPWPAAEHGCSLGASPTESGAASRTSAATAANMGLEGCGGAEAWHEISAVRAQDPLTGTAVLVLTQVDVSAKVAAERHLLRVMCAERRLLLQLFPRHVLQHVVAANPLLGGGARPSSAPCMGRAGGEGGAEGCGEEREWLEGGDWRPVLRDCDTLATLHPQATVLFADIAGFDDLCMELPPQRVLAFLNTLFAKFDGSIERFGVHKMETIGGLFIVAGGLLVEEDDGAVAVRERWDPLHADKVFMFAKAMLHVAAKSRMPDSDQPVKLRIGLHTGPVMSGVVGTRVPRFVLFGDTVNTASRMQTSCVPGSIHVTEDTRRLLPHHDWTPTGGMQIKGKGFLHTYVWAPEEPIPLLLAPPATLAANGAGASNATDDASSAAGGSAAGGSAAGDGTGSTAGACGALSTVPGGCPGRGSLAAALLSTVGESESCTSSELGLALQLSFSCQTTQSGRARTLARVKTRLRVEARDGDL